MWATFTVVLLYFVPAAVKDLHVVEEQAVEGEVRRVAGTGSMFFHGLLFSLERAWMVSALEAASVYILETEFGWGSDWAGFAVGVTFVGTLPITLLAFGLNLRGSLSDAQMLVGSCCWCVLGTLCFFPQLASVCGMGGRGAAMLLLVGDCIVFSMGYFANGVVDGLVISALSANSAFNKVNYVVLRNIVADFCGRLLGPPAARALLAAKGRVCYAGLQLGLALLVCVACSQVLRHLPEKETGKAAGRSAEDQQ